MHALMNCMDTPTLGHGISVADLYRREALVRLDGIFLAQLERADPALHQALLQARANPAEVSRSTASDLAVRIGPILDAFIGQLFGLDGELSALKARHTELDVLFKIKREFVQRQAAKNIKAEEAARIGLVNRVVAPGSEREEALALARKIAAKSTHVVNIGKEAFYRQAELDLAAAYAYASNVMVENMLARDAEEGIAAFVEKRPPTWEDR